MNYYKKVVLMAEELQAIEEKIKGDIEFKRGYHKEDPELVQAIEELYTEIIGSLRELGQALIEGVKE